MTKRLDLDDALDLEAFRRGDHALFERLIRTLSPRLLASVRPLVRPPDDALDVVQEAWQKAFVRRLDYRGDGSIVGWLLTIARHTALARQRRDAARPAFVALESGMERDPADPARHAMRRALVDAVATLPSRERDTVICRLLLGCSTRETAQRLGWDRRRLTHIQECRQCRQSLAELEVARDALAGDMECLPGDYANRVLESLQAQPARTTSRAVRVAAAAMIVAGLGAGR